MDVNRRYYGTWRGGASYNSNGSYDLEEFEDLDAARAALHWRYVSNGHWPCQFDFVARPPESLLCPAVEEDSEIALYAAPDDERPVAVLYLDDAGQTRVEWKTDHYLIQAGLDEAVVSVRAEKVEQ
jgi:hypothetical protein